MPPPWPGSSISSATSGTQPAWLFLATTGCRRGEALGLRWADIDLDTGKVSIRQTASTVAHEIRVAPRTKSGKPRPIELDKTTIAALRAVRVRQAQERLLRGPDFHEHADGLLRDHERADARIGR